MFEAPGKPVARAVDHRIDLIDPMAPPPCPWLYRMSEDELLAVKCTISGYIHKGWIIPSSSPYWVPVLVIHKKTGELCIVIDYHLLSKLTFIDAYPIPCIDELLDCLAKAKYFTKIDLESGYH